MKKIVIILSIIIILVFIFLMVVLFNINSKSKDIINKNEQDLNNQFSKLSYYKSENLNRYKKYKTSNNNLSNEDIITRVNLNLDMKYYTNTLPSNNLNTNYVLVNKFNYLSYNYIPSKLELLDNSYAKDGIYLVHDAKESLENMLKKAKEEGMDIRVISAYRSYTYQENLYNNYVKSDGVTKADTYSARPGFSEHQTGLVIDVTKAFDNFNNFENTEEYSWMLDNSYKYGFILRYPKGKEDITTYNFEAWHFRYVGEDLAKKIKASNLTFDEYYVRYLENNN